ncbi:uncharacterized protein C20orf204 homolog isoform X1 [Manis javanica]|uniref:uncharacterized protein C20orf204 homolog isoform X1 n=1 Tax=Manis javanica TaxID=9974 RepID=UPI003C6D259C
MVPPKPALWALLLALLGMVPSWAGLHTCSIPDVLRHYRAVIFEDLQAAVRRVGPGVEGTRPGSRHLYVIQKNLTGAAALQRRRPVGASCRAQKEHSILLSIASLGETLRGAVAGARRDALEKAAWTVAVRTEAVMRRHCRTPRQVCVPECVRVRIPAPLLPQRRCASHGLGAHGRVRTPSPGAGRTRGLPGAGAGTVRPR